MLDENLGPVFLGKSRKSFIYISFYEYDIIYKFYTKFEGVRKCPHMELPTPTQSQRAPRTFWTDVICPSAPAGSTPDGESVSPLSLCLSLLPSGAQELADPGPIPTVLTQ